MGRRLTTHTDAGCRFCLGRLEHLHPKSKVWQCVDCYNTFTTSELGDLPKAVVRSGKPCTARVSKRKHLPKQ